MDGANKQNHLFKLLFRENDEFSYTALFFCEKCGIIREDVDGEPSIYHRAKLHHQFPEVTPLRCLDLGRLSL